MFDLYQRINRNELLSVKEDYELNVKPFVPEGCYAEELFTLESVENNDNTACGWWIIENDFYEKLEKSLDEIEDEYYGAEYD